MYRILAAAILVLLISGNGICSETDKISVIETELFKIEYKDEAIDKRLNRIEKYLFGKTNKGTSEQRVKVISESSGISFEPKKTEEEKRIAAAELNPEDSNVNYPVIDMMEEKVFGRASSGENVYKRLAKLEHKMFGNASQGDLSERTDKLKAKVLTSRPEKITYDDEYNPQYYQNSGPRSIAKVTLPVGTPNKDRQRSAGYTTGGAAQAGEIDMDYGLATLENIFFGKPDTSSSPEKRLSKLEKKILKKTFESDTNTARLERIATAASAKGNAGEYNENKWNKYISTGIQVGTILLMILAMIL